MRKQRKNSELLENIGIALRKHREQRGLSQEDVINDTGIHIGRIETATVNISVSTLYDLCKYYDISLSQIISEIEQN